MDSSSLLEVLQLSGHPLGMLGNVLGGRRETQCSYFIEYLNICQVWGRRLYFLYLGQVFNRTPVYKVRG